MKQIAVKVGSGVQHLRFVVKLFKSACVLKVHPMPSTLAYRVGIL